MLVFCPILSISTLVLSGLAIADAQEEQTEEVRGTTGASFTVQRDISTGGWSSGSGGSYSTQEFMTEDMIREIASVDGIQGYDASLITLASIFNADGENWNTKIIAFITMVPTTPSIMSCSCPDGLNWWKAPISQMICQRHYYQPGAGGVEWIEGGRYTDRNLLPGE